MALRYRRVGPWRSALVTGTACIWFSLGATSALAWRVFASTRVA